MRISIREMVLVAFFAALTAIGAQISLPLPFSPVPVTLQVLFVLLSGALLGRKLGALSQVIYLFLGVIGLPIFAQFRGGIAVLAGPTGGYLVGFVIAAYLVGLAVEKVNLSLILRLVVGMVLGLIVIYFLGFLWLSYVLKVSLVKALVVGVVPFLIGDFFKILAAVLVTASVYPHLSSLKAGKT